MNRIVTSENPTSSSNQNDETRQAQSQVLEALEVDESRTFQTFQASKYEEVSSTHIGQIDSNRGTKETKNSSYYSSRHQSGVVLKVPNITPKVSCEVSEIPNNRKRTFDEEEIIREQLKRNIEMLWEKLSQQLKICDNPSNSSKKLKENDPNEEEFPAAL